MIVLDASAAIEWLLVRELAPSVAARFSDSDVTVHAPSLIGVGLLGAALEGPRLVETKKWFRCGGSPVGPSWSEGGRPVTEWRTRWLATAASGTGSHDLSGWVFTDLRQRRVWSVFRADGGDFPVFSARRGDGEVPSLGDLEAMTRTAVADLLAAADLSDDHGWLTKNISAALLLASSEVTRWEGAEWALESGNNDEAWTWAGADAPRVPFHWLRAVGIERDTVIGNYQGDVNFGLCFDPVGDLPAPGPTLPDDDGSSLRPRRDIPLTTGRITAVEVVYDTIVDGGPFQGLVAEVLLHSDRGSTLLIAAEAHGTDAWCLHDEAVAAVPTPASADELRWVPKRRPWRSTEGNSPPTT